MTTSLTDQEFKQTLKDAVVEALQEQRELLLSVLVEALEEVALSEAIREGQQSQQTTRDAVFRVLQGPQ